MLLNRAVVKQWKKYGSILTGICVDSSPKESIFLICDTLLSFHNKTQQQIYVFFNIIVAGDFFQAIICAFGT